MQLARVLAQIRGEENPGCRYLFLDEPVSALDPAHQHLVLGLAAETAAAGAVVVAVLHDVNLAAQYGSDWLVLKKGKTMAQGKVEEILSAALIEETFGVRASLWRDESSGAFAIMTSGVSAGRAISETEGKTRRLSGAADFRKEECRSDAPVVAGREV